MKFPKLTLPFIAATILAMITSSPLEADLLYTIEGIANDFPDPLQTPEVASGETFVAEFRIDSLTPDSDPASDRGEYTSAIIASSISFSGGYTSMVDFAGGELVILQNSGGFGAVSLSDLAGNGSFLFGGSPPFASDEILDESTPVLDGPLTLISLTAPNDADKLFTDLNDDQGALWALRRRSFLLMNTSISSWPRANFDSKKFSHL